MKLGAQKKYSCIQITLAYYKTHLSGNIFFFPWNLKPIFFTVVLFFFFLITQRKTAAFQAKLKLIL